MKNIGLYIHVPFCRGKCPYCDFYSLKFDEDMLDRYTEEVINKLKLWSEKLSRKADTLYFGGGTPSVMGGERIALITEGAKKLFGLKGAEITAECNPSCNLESFMRDVSEAGVNRISIGMQSAVDRERKALGRCASAEDVMRAVGAAKKAEIGNISLDLMIGIPYQTIESLKYSVDFCARAGVKHVSAYMLKIEEGTLFYKKRDSLNIPDEDGYCEMYSAACEELKKNGFAQYEISNFAVKGYESRHNLKYWNDEEYLGIGPSAHSFIDGKRFYYERNLEGFLGGNETVSEGTGGDFEEYAMLRLRLSEGLTEKGTAERFGMDIPEKMRTAAEKLQNEKLLTSDNDGIRLTEKGFLLSNSVICELLM